nr:MAG TPA: hypothetical protein [Bacteriophage sp.]
MNLKLKSRKINSSLLFNLHRSNGFFSDNCIISCNLCHLLYREFQLIELIQGNTHVCQCSFHSCFCCVFHKPENKKNLLISVTDKE